MTVRPPDQTGEDALDEIVERIRVASFEAPKAGSHTEWATRIRSIFEQVGWVHVDSDDGSTVRHTFVATSFLDPKWDQPVFRLRPGQEGGDRDYDG